MVLFYTFLSCIERLWLFSNGYLQSRFHQGLSSSCWKRSKKQGRKSHRFRTDENSCVSMTKWFDNKCVQIITNYCNPASVVKVRRWDRQKRQFIETDCPTVTEKYNKSMDGVDLSDMLISLYRTPIKTNRRFPKVLFHCVDIVKLNAWLVYRCHCNQLKVPKELQLHLMKFTMMIAGSALIKSRTNQRTVSHPSKRKSDGDLPLERWKQPAPVHITDVSIWCRSLTWISRKEVSIL